MALCLFAGGAAQADKHEAERIAEAESAAPKTITKDATIKTPDGKVLRQGTNGWTCYPGSAVIGPMCNRAQWDALLGALQKREPIDVKEFSVSYMLAGEGDAIGVSNSDPFATDPATKDDWVKEGPHLMTLVPDPAILEGLSTDPKDPVYVMWKGTPLRPHHGQGRKREVGADLADQPTDPDIPIAGSGIQDVTFLHELAAAGVERVLLASAKNQMMLEFHLSSSVSRLDSRSAFKAFRAPHRDGSLCRRL